MNLPDVSTLGTLGIGAGIAALVAGWQQVRGCLARIVGILVISVEFRHLGASAARMYCHRVLRTTPTPMRLYIGDTIFIRPLTRFGLVFREALNGTRLFWKGFKPILVVDVTQSDDGKKAGIDIITFRFLRGTFNPDQLALDIAKTANDTIIKKDACTRFRIVRRSGQSNKKILTGGGEQGSSPPQSAPFASGVPIESQSRLIGWKETDIGEVRPDADPLERMALTPAVEEMVAELQRWADSKDWYLTRQIPWRRGVLLHGIPGTGKSSLVKAIAQKMNIPIYLLDISTMDNEEFHCNYTAALLNAPCIILIEDIDAVFDKRENIATEKGKGLTFDCLLNTISGVESSDGILLVITTNHIEKVDAALGTPQLGSLSSRPGRIDRAVEMPILIQEGRYKLARRILAGCHESWIDHLVEQGERDTGAQFEDRCSQIALALFWSSDPKRPAPTVNAEEVAA